MMQWEKLYSPRRAGDALTKEYNPDQSRNSYMRDYDRIIFASAFRRLQNKTQVFPLPGAVFVHNRLTHSLEVASVGRSLGKLVGEQLVAKHPEFSIECADFYAHNLAYVIAAACLAHDIGNPPFGHSGEDAIREYFEQMPPVEKQIIQAEISAEQWQDFVKFEGNSNAIRALSHAFGESEIGGYRLTYTCLAAIVKYPCLAADGFQKEKGIGFKKSGFFVSEKETYAQIAQSLNITQYSENIYARHPFVYLVEAADDICYRIIDLEDAHRLGIISLETFKNLFLDFFNHDPAYKAYLIQKIDRYRDHNQQVQFIRGSWINYMVKELAALFIKHEKALLNGTLKTDLLSCLSDEKKALINTINKFSFQKIYNHKSVVEIELSGFNIIGQLLKAFVHAVLYPNEAKSKKLLLLIPEQFPIQAHNKREMYHNIQSVVDFIAGMTDLYASELYRKISSIREASF